MNNETNTEKRTTNPVVFFSYAWEIQPRARALANRLMVDGVQVIADFFEVKLGNNLIAFMQRPVNDESIEKVLILCDKTYRDKANNFVGGVGTEATIISPELYGKINQTKFIGVVMERDSAGKPYLPTMLKTNLFVDLSNPDTELQEYRRLVKELWGVPVVQKPMLGDRPKWIDMPTVDTTALEQIGKQVTLSLPIGRHSSSGIIKFAHEIVHVLTAMQNNKDASTDLLGLIAQTEPIRNQIIDFLDGYLQKADCDGEDIATLFETVWNEISFKSGLAARLYSEIVEAYKFLLWELFICAIALMVEYGRYACMRKLLWRTYFLHDIGTNNSTKACSYDEFRSHLRLLEEDYRMRITDRRPISYSGHLLVAREYGNVIVKRNLVNADIMLAHLSVGDDALLGWYPVLAPWCSYAGNDLIWKRLISRAFCTKVLPLFDVRGINELRMAVEQTNDAWQKSSLSTTGAAWGGIPPILYKFSANDIGSRP